MAGSPPEDLLRPGELRPGTQVGRYRLRDIVGRGGMGTVYRTFDEETKREVALKLLLPDLPETLRQRFLTECEAEAQIRHAHVMPVYDRGTFDEDRLYFVMELVYEPITLSDLVEARESGKLATTWPRLRHWAHPTRLVHDVFIPICEGVDAANREYRILHRDLKPDNVLIDVRTRRAYLIDFGICHKEGTPLEKGKIVGTPRFLSPEQAVAKIDERSDVWGLGALLYYVLTAHPPIASSSPMRKEERDRRARELGEEEKRARSKGNEARADELASRYASLMDPSFRTFDDILQEARDGIYLPLPESVPAAARAIVTKAMAKEPENRYANAAALAHDLEAWVKGAKVQALGEQDARTAAVAAAGRTLRRHLGTTLLVLAGLVLGGLLGHRFLSGEAPTTRERVEEAIAEAEALERELDVLAASTPGAIEGGLRWRGLRVRIDRLSSIPHLLRLPAGEERDRVERAASVLEKRTAPPRLMLAVGEEGTWRAESLVDDRGHKLEKGSNPLPPGPYWVFRDRTPGLRIPIVLPLAIRSAKDVNAGGTGPPTVELVVALPADGVPAGMVYVPSGPPAPDEDPIPAFLIGENEVTYLEYAEWLDELDEADRAGHLPEEGFEPNTNNPGRYLLRPDYEDRAVTGIRPADAAAYAAWRSELYGRAHALPSDTQWRRAAGGALLDARYALFFRPMQAGGDGGVVPDRSPYGAEGLLTSPMEYVVHDGAFWRKGGGTPAGAVPSPMALARRSSASAHGRTDAGFRLVQAVR